MFVYRLSRTQYVKDLNGTGAKLFGGRWNHIGTPCIYTAESRSLATLEYSVNVNIDYIPRALSICVFEIDESQIKEIKTRRLPGNWCDIPAPYSTKDFGTKLLKKGEAILKIPSTVIPEEWNFIINPLVEKKHFKLVEVKDFIYDLRIKINNS
ncbi:MAG: RES family NAD+ phosphorylase [Moheibacter sp.]